MTVDLYGKLIWRGDVAYEPTRRSLLWNKWIPARFPDVIVRVSCEKDVVAAVNLARSRALRVAVRGRGHSWCGSPLRDGGMLIDLSQLRELSIDVDSREATVQPGVTGREFAVALAEHRLGFPVGHCGSVPMSGYLLAGGLGWNIGSWGPACFSVRRIDVVTAEGELVGADEQRNTDLFWAARGAGAGFFGVATRFAVAVYPLPKVIRRSTYVYPIATAEGVEEIARWAGEIRRVLPASVEMPIFLASPPEGPAASRGQRVLVVTAAAFADNENEAAESLSQLESCPALSRAVMREHNEPASIGGLQDSIGRVLPEGYRYAADSLWSNEPLPTLLPGLAEQIVSAPSTRSVVIAVPIPPPPPGAAMPDAAFSMVGRTNVLCYAIWENETDDDANQRWLRETQERLEPHVIGHYIAEADLSAGPSRATRSFAPPNWQRLRDLKKQCDPQNVFYSYLGLE